MTILTRVEIAARSVVRKYFPHKSMSILDDDPDDQEALEYRANRLLDEMHNEDSRSPLETCQYILAIIEESYPTEKLAVEYFRNLEILLAGMPRLSSPGQLVIGLGPGRCGSTSLSAMLGTVTNSCSTHETPPPIFWKPRCEQVDFHVRRFRMLTNYYSLVADVSHWWLNAINQIFDQFPDAKAVGLIRDSAECAVSFMRIQGFGKGSYNPWVTRGNSVWRAGRWDPTYPSYPIPRHADKIPDRAKFELIHRYVMEYNAQLEEMARNAPDRIHLVRTEELSKDTAQEEIFRIANARGQTSNFKLNVKKTADGKKNRIRL